jgi:hypothetical protein
MADERLKLRAELLAEAERIISNDRNKSYGEPDEDFQRIAGIASAMGFRIDAGGGEIRELRGSDVATFMIALKLSRLMWSPGHRDSWLDIAGYAGCGYETATLEEQRRTAVQPVSSEPTRIDTVNGNFSRDVIEAAHAAIGGDPTALEAAGYILVDASDIKSWLKCGACIEEHKFSDNCAYRIRVRRHG